MAYKVSKADGRAVVIQDYSKEIIGGLNLLGYGFTNYSDEISQNFVKDLENNAGNVEPVNPVLGQFWFYIPTAATTDNKILRICVSTSAATLDGRWKTLMSITPSNDVQVDAWTLRGKAPVTPSGGSTGVGQPVVLDSNGKVNAAYLPTQSTQTNVDTANKIARTSTFGSRNSGLPFNGTQDVPLTTSHIAEGDQTYFTTARARGAISATGVISYNASTGVISYDPPPASAAVNSFNGRTGAVTLTVDDLTGTLGFTPVNKAGDSMTGALGVNNNQIIIGGQSEPGIYFNGTTANRIEYNSDSQTWQLWAANQPMLSVGMNPESMFHRGDGRVWTSNYMGPDTGLNADMVDGKHASEFMTAGSFNNSVGETGYQLFPDGLVLQWGRYRAIIRDEVTRTVTLPVAVSVIYVGQATSYVDQWSETRDLWMIRQGNGTTTSVTFGFQSSTKNDQYSNGFDWIIIGKV